MEEGLDNFLSQLLFQENYLSLSDCEMTINNGSVKICCIGGARYCKTNFLVFLSLKDPQFDFRLSYLEKDLPELNKTLSYYDLPAPTYDWTTQGNARVVGTYDSTDEASKAADLIGKVNQEQKHHFDTIVEAVLNTPDKARYYIHGTAGTGKTFLYKTICHYMRGLEKSVLCATSTGIAALLLPDGRTPITGLPYLSIWIRISAAQSKNIAQLAGP